MDVERVDHICFNVPDNHEESAPLIAKGCEVSFLYSAPSGLTSS